MANRRYKSEFIPSFENRPVMLMGSYAISAIGVAASLVDNGITYTAKTFGTAGNSITIALVAGGTAGSEVVTVTGNAISVAVQSGVSTRTQVKTAIDGSAAAAALVSVSVTSGGTAATLLAATALASGVDLAGTSNLRGMSLVQTNTGLYKLNLQDQYSLLLHMDVQVSRATAVDLVSQVISSQVATSSKYVTFRLLTGATETNAAVNDTLYFKLMLRNSTV